jgi:hypothetical protein
MMRAFDGGLTLVIKTTILRLLRVSFCDSGVRLGVNRKRAMKNLQVRNADSASGERQWTA